MRILGSFQRFSGSFHLWLAVLFAFRGHQPHPVGSDKAAPPSPWISYTKAAAYLLYCLRNVWPVCYNNDRGRESGAGGGRDSPCLARASRALSKPLCPLASGPGLARLRTLAATGLARPGQSLPVCSCDR